MRERRLSAAFPEGDPARWVGYVSVGATVIFATATILAVVDPNRFVVAHFFLSVSMFGVGCLLFMWVLLAMALRSRDDMLSIAGIFLLSDSAPASTRKILLGSLAAQVVVSVAGAAARPFTPLAVGTLVPLLGLAMVGWWATRFGHFEPHPSGVDPNGVDPGATGRDRARR